MAVSANTASLPLIDAGKLVLLAVASDKRVASLPDTPTVKEAGLDVVTAGWLGFAAPAGIEAAVRDKLIDAFVRAARDPQVRSALIRAGTEPVDLAGDAFSALVRREFDRLRELNKTLQIAVQGVRSCRGGCPGRQAGSVLCAVRALPFR